MIYSSNYSSPLGKILLAANDNGLTGLWFYGSKHFAEGLSESRTAEQTHILRQAEKWLDIYFDGCEPDFTPPLAPTGSEFQLKIWDILLRIPYGQTMTYGEIAMELARKEGIERMSAQAVGGAVGHNRISIIIPCHRVVGTDGKLTGYAGGTERKAALLALERLDRNVNQ